MPSFISHPNSATGGVVRWHSGGPAIPWSKSDKGSGGGAADITSARFFQTHYDPCVDISANAFLERLFPRARDNGLSRHEIVSLPP